MIQIKIISVGKIKEKYLLDGIREYEKRLQRYCRLQFIQVPDEKTPDGAPRALEEQIKRTEGERICRQIGEQEYVIALDIAGEAPDSMELARRMEVLGVQGHSSLTFVIGGSLGLSGAVLNRARYRLSFSRLTFPHQLMRLILLEQLYRSFRIIHGEPYHK